MSRSAWSRRARAARRAARTGSVGLPGGVDGAQVACGCVHEGYRLVGAVEAFAERAGDVVGLFGAAGRAGAPGAERLGDRGALGGGGLPFGQGEVGAVEVGDAQAAAPQDLGDGGLAAGAQSAGAELAGGVQVPGCPVVGVGGDAVAAPVGVVELDVDAPGPGSVQGGDAPAGGQGAARLHGCPCPFREGRTGRGRVVWAGKDRPRAMSGEIQSAPVR